MAHLPNCIIGTNPVSAGSIDDRCLEPPRLHTTAHRETWFVGLGNSLAATAVVAMLVNGLLFALFFALATPRYQTNDDTAMMMIASGLMTGEPSEFLVFTNILIGRLLKWLYELNDRFPWYAWYLYGTHFAGTTAVLFALLRRHFSRVSISVYLLLFLAIEVRLLLNVQFTSTALVSATGGLLLLLGASADRRRWSYVVVAAGIFLLAWSAMIRAQAFYLAMLLCLPALHYESWRRRSMRIPVILCAAVLPALLAIGYNELAYSNHPEWRKFIQYNSVRRYIHDYPTVEYNDSTKFFFDRIGWSETDTEMFRNWCFADEELYSQEKIESILQPFGRRGRVTGRAIKELDAPFQHIELYVIFTVFGFVAALQIVRDDRYHFTLASLVTLLVFGAVFVGLGVFAKAKMRVTLGALFEVNALIFLLQSGLMHGPNEDGRQSRLQWRDAFIMARGRTLLLLGIVVAMGRCLYLITVHHERLDQHNRAYDRAFNHITEKLIEDLVDRDNGVVFVSWAGHFRTGWMDPFGDHQKLARIPLLPLGWLTHSPHYRAILERRSIDNLYKAMYQLPNVYLLCNDTSKAILPTFVREHYHEEIAFDPDRYYWFEHETVAGARETVIRKAALRQAVKEVVEKHDDSGDGSSRFDPSPTNRAAEPDGIPRDDAGLRQPAQ